MWKVLNHNDTNQTCSYMNQHGWISTLCWVKEARHKEYTLDRDIHFQNRPKHIRRENSERCSPRQRASSLKEARDFCKDYDAFLFWVWFPTRSVFTLRILMKLYMMIYVYFNKERENILLREFYSHNEKNTRFFFSVKEWEKSTEIAHLSFASLKGIFNNLENTPWNFEIKKNQCLRIITPFNLSIISIQS